MKKWCAWLLALVCLFTACLLPAAAADDTLAPGEVVLGDVNSDFKVEATDARLLLQIAAGLRTVTDAQADLLDMDRNGTVSATDARWALQIAARLRVKRAYNPETGEIRDLGSLYSGTRITVVSYNTAAPWGSFWDGTSSNKRAPLFAEQIEAIAPDSVGVQEINSNWVSRMETLLPSYAYYGVKRGGDGSEKTSEMCGIFYLKDKYELLDSGTFWLSETPDVESAYPGAGCNRICSYVVLENKQTGFTYAHFNTHLDNVSEAARTLGGNLIAERAAAMAESYGGALPVVITGDFNQNRDGTACAALENAGFVNAQPASEDTQPTYHAWGEQTTGQAIDFIFRNDAFASVSHHVYAQTADGTYVSDHYAVGAELQVE